MITIPVVLILFLILFVIFFFRVLDEILFLSYRKTVIKKPIFIIGNPRSGTTFMHRLMSLDSEQYACMKLYHTIIPSVTFFKLVNVFTALDAKIGRPMEKFFSWVDGLIFKKWDNIHPTGFNQIEEDEGLYMFTFLTIAVCLICPYMQHMTHLTIIDKLPETSKKRLQSYFKSCLKRFMYVEGQHKTLLTKNVITTGRLHTILEVLPDARIVYMVRDPRQSVPSFVSMFSVTWKLIAPEIKKGDIHYRALAQACTDLYQYFYTQKNKYIDSNFMTIFYDEFKQKPAQTVFDIYNFYELPITNDFKNIIFQSTSLNSNYKSKHQYNIEDYGITEADIEKQLSGFMETYGFLSRSSATA